MTDPLPALRTQLARQVAHWNLAVSELSDLTRLASPMGWRGLERYLDVAVEGALRQCVERLTRQGAVLEAQLRAAETPAEHQRLSAEVIAFRQRYLATETVLDFYGDAINTRTNDKLGAYLRACDLLAIRSMTAVLEPLGKRTPPVLTYVDKGLGASILKAGLRLWDGRSLSPVAAIKIVRHNLPRPTALLHEAGHQVAHLLDWTDELASALQRKLSRSSGDLASTWSSWASEIAADAFAFGHTGYAAVAALHDVLAGDSALVLSVLPYDPHPTSYLRVLLGREMCARFYGRGPWDDLASAWVASHPLEGAKAGAEELLRASVRVLPEVVEILYFTPFRAFGQRPFSAALDPGRVKPEVLLDLERTAGKALYTSSHWIERECVRLLALTGYRAATEPERAQDILRQQERWMLRLGAHAMAA
jgi:hypothetical protein